MATYDPTGLENSGPTNAQITGPHIATDTAGDTYDYFTCAECGLETTDETIQTRGCWRCDQ